MVEDPIVTITENNLIQLDSEAQEKTVLWVNQGIKENPWDMLDSMNMMTE